ncbi:uncharacterized protein LOC115440111 [Manduca sexta]|uniref:uncharacterized protein LOC115440111 n=1 Tax=Manduca sexta TaxID=7130 RepID=UPI00188DCD8D|nr:uncharacterized protein LOC115440111 [Manduca sexta]
MNLQWLKSSPNLTKGIGVINELEDARFEHFLRRIVSKLKTQSSEIFTEEEMQKLEKIFKITHDDLLLSVKTIIYIFKRLHKFIFMPLDLKNDLKEIGFYNEKADFIVKVWSSDTRLTLNELSGDSINDSSDSLHFSWKLNAELSSDTCKKSKVPKAYLTLAGDKETSVIELTHSELYSMFIQFESIQNELDNLI